ncbi:hypothetical protein [Cryobacterium sp. N19]|uniref:hypothetical protein n=1 Tax=Cryobacterium sp. N19 TaxID=2048288 RepID=UPI000CE2B7A5|nr:hypothetical protein [Cryobacterium sp. N19]
MTIDAADISQAGDPAPLTLYPLDGQVDYTAAELEWEFLPWERPDGFDRMIVTFQVLPFRREVLDELVDDCVETVYRQFIEEVDTPDYVFNLGDVDQGHLQLIASTLKGENLPPMSVNSIGHAMMNIEARFIHCQTGSASWVRALHFDEYLKLRELSQDSPLKWLKGMTPMIVDSAVAARALGIDPAQIEANDEVVFIYPIF